MNKHWLLLMSIAFSLSSCTNKVKEGDILPEVPEGAEAVSLLGEPLSPYTPFKDSLVKYKVAKDEYEANTMDADKIIWFGRWTAYKGNFRDAIRIYTEGIQKFPNDARFYRHRGHRYISIREFDRAIKDLEQAVKLIRDKKDEVEPDGQPNVMNIPVSTLHTNIWYHLGLAYYLKHDLDNALYAYRQCIKTTTNDDMLVATTHWLYMTLCLMNHEEEAKKILEPIHSEMTVIENMSYYQLCMFYKGNYTMEELTDKNLSNFMRDAMAYGKSNWYFYNDDKERARELLKHILQGKEWASFGYIAAEADLVRKFK